MRLGSGMAAASVVMRNADAADNSVLATALRERQALHRKEASVLKETLGLVTDVAVLFEQERMSDKVAEVTDLGRELMMLQANLDANLHVLRELIGGEHQKTNETPSKFMERRVQELDSSRARLPDAFTRHENWIKMRQELWNVHHAGEPLPELAGEELVVVQRGGALKCPISQDTLVEPVRSTVCGHTFSRTFIEEYIRRKLRSGNVTCPMAGCSAHVTSDALERDMDAERALAQSKRGAKRAKAPLELQ